MRIGNGLWVPDEKPRKEKEADRKIPVAHKEMQSILRVNSVEAGILIQSLGMYESYYAAELKPLDVDFLARTRKKLQRIVDENPVLIIG